VAFGQPALSLAAQLVRRAGRIGYPAAADADAAENPDVTGSDVGEELLRLVAEATRRGMDPELELRRVARRLADRVRAWERRQS
jgi:XTP/dITP diphosphohydrolase